MSLRMVKKKRSRRRKIPILMPLLPLFRLKLIILVKTMIHSVSQKNPKKRMTNQRARPSAIFGSSIHT